MRKTLLLLALILFCSANLSFADNTTTSNTDAKTKALFTKGQQLIAGRADALENQAESYVND